LGAGERDVAAEPAGRRDVRASALKASRRDGRPELPSTLALASAIEPPITIRCGLKALT
jgi:hypothetical protein